MRIPAPISDKIKAGIVWIIDRRRDSMKKDDCIFCRIANGEIPSNTVYEDEDFRCILDLSPAAKGHTLVIPKEHFQDALNADDEVLSKIFKVAAKVGEGMKKALNADGINIVQNNGEAAGQTVPHLHVHVIPRYNGDEKMVTWTQHESDSEEQKRIAEKIAAMI